MVAKTILLAILLTADAGAALAQSTSADALAWDVDGSGTLTAGDVFLSGAAAGTVVLAGDTREGQALEPATFVPRLFDADGASSYTLGDVAYHDADANGIVSVGDVQYGEGSFGRPVAPGDANVGSPLLDPKGGLQLVTPRNGTGPSVAYLSPSAFAVESPALRMTGASRGTQVQPRDPEAGLPTILLPGKPSLLRAQPPPTTTTATPPTTTTPVTPVVTPTPTAPPEGDCASAAITVGGGACVPKWAVIVLVGALAVSAGGGVATLLIRADQARWAREAEEGEPGGSCPLDAGPKSYKTSLDPQWKDVDPSRTKVVSMTLTPLLEDGKRGEPEKIEGDALDPVNDALLRRIVGASREDLRPRLEPLALDLVRAARAQAKARGAASDVEVEARLEASSVPFEIKLCRCEESPGGPAWKEKKSWTATLQDARNAHVVTLRRVAPPGRARDDPLVGALASVLARFVEDTHPFFARGLSLEISDTEG